MSFRPLSEVQQSCVEGSALFLLKSAAKDTARSKNLAISTASFRSKSNKNEKNKVTFIKHRNQLSLQPGFVVAGSDQLSF